jgi:hypothetical protein
MYDFMCGRGIDSAFGIAIKDKDGTVVAFMALEFFNKEAVDIAKIDRILKDKQKVVETLLRL